MSDALNLPNMDSPALNELAIRESLPSSVDVDSIEILPSVKSTNSFLLEQPIIAGKAKVCLAEAQTSGRGRRGNDWQSASNKNIMLSLSWGFTQWPETITGLGLAVALVVAERLNSDYQVGVGIKWPNDLLIEGEKLAGVLVDVSGDVDGACSVVLGLGLNVHQPDWSRSLGSASASQNGNKSADYAWTDLYSQGVVIDRNNLAANIIKDWVLMLQEFDEHGFSLFVQRWNDLSCHNNKQITLSKPGSTEKVSGEMLGVNKLGALLIRSGGGEQYIVTDSRYSLRLAS